MGYSAFFSPDLGNYPVACIHEKLTGEPCPSCGLSHAFSLILSGRTDEALEWNEYSVRVFLFFFLQLILRGVLSGFYIRASGTRSRNAIVTTDIVITMTLFLVAFIPFMEFVVRSFAGMF
jgi:hypothetical protein